MLKKSGVTAPWPRGLDKELSGSVPQVVQAAQECYFFLSLMFFSSFVIFGIAFFLTSALPPSPAFRHTALLHLSTISL